MARVLRQPALFGLAQGRVDSHTHSSSNREIRNDTSQ